MPRPTGLVQLLDQHLHKAGLIPRRATLLMACSGGADSVALVHLMAAISKSDHWQWKLVIAHINHRTRPRDNALDEKAVGKLATEVKVPLVIRRLRASHQHTSENALRIERWDKLIAIAKKQKCRYILTGHHADDQAETVLLRLLRGAGARGLRAIQPSRSVGKNVIVRPLLGVTRAELKQYLIERGIGWREDKSNQDPRWLRNRLRHEGLPVLKRYQPQLVQSLCRTAAYMRQVQSLIEEQVAMLSAQHAAAGFNFRGAELSRNILRDANAIVAMEFLRQWLIQSGVKADRLHHMLLAELHRQIVRNKSGIVLPVDAGHQLSLERERVVRQTRKPRTTEMQ